MKCEIYKTIVVDQCVDFADSNICIYCIYIHICIYSSLKTFFKWAFIVYMYICPAATMNVFRYVCAFCTEGFNKDYNISRRNYIQKKKYIIR